MICQMIIFILKYVLNHVEMSDIHVVQNHGLFINLEDKMKHRTQQIISSTSFLYKLLQDFPHQPLLQTAPC